MWQALRSEVVDRGVEIVTVALDTGGADAARPHIEAAAPEHPSLIDAAHVCDELFGFVNVPNAVWIDEDGMIVRPAEAAFPGYSPVFDEINRAADAADDVELEVISRVAGFPMTAGTFGRSEMADLNRQIRTEPELYREMVLDWAEHGSASRFALQPDEVVRRSAPRSPDVARAAAHFELGQHLHRAGEPEAAVPHFREAHRLQPDNWTYKRQAWRFDPRAYDGNWVADVKEIGAENYYPPIQP